MLRTLSYEIEEAYYVIFRLSGPYYILLDTVRVGDLNVHMVLVPPSETAPPSWPQVSVKAAGDGSCTRNMYRIATAISASQGLTRAPTRPVHEGRLRHAPHRSLS